MKRRICTALSTLLVTVTLFAQQDPNVAKGFEPDKTYDFSGVDAVNLFNGSLTLTIPLGQQYAVGPRLSYKFALVYTGNNWAMENNTWYSPGGSTATPHLATKANYYTPYEELTRLDKLRAGLGWHLTLGGNLTNLTEGVPRAAQRSFDSALHDDQKYDPVSQGYPNANTGVDYANDGSYLRRRGNVACIDVDPDDTGNDKIVHPVAPCHEVDSPDGTIYHYDSKDNLFEIRDAFKRQDGSVPNWVRITRTTGANNALTMKVADSVGRTHTLNFRRMMSVGGPVTGSGAAPDGNLGSTVEYTYHDVLTSVQLASFNGGTAEYSLSYADVDNDASTLQAVPISRKYAVPQDCAVPKVAHVPLLEKVTPPDGLAWEMEYDRGDLTYFSDSTLDASVQDGGGVGLVRLNAGGSGYTSEPAVVFSGGGGQDAAATVTVVNGALSEIVVTNPGTGYTSAPTVTISGGGGTGATAVADVCKRTRSHSGNVTELKLPTGGTIDWTYRVWRFPPSSPGRLCKGPTGLREPCKYSERHSVGIEQRLMRDAGGAVAAKRVYGSDLVRPDGSTIISAHTLASTVTDYEGFVKTGTSAGTGGAPALKVENYYSVGTKSRESLPGSNKAWAYSDEYGLPFTRYSESGSAFGVPNPDTSITNDTGKSRFLSTKTLDGSGKLLQYTYVAYEGDVHESKEYTHALGNRRVRDESIVYVDATDVTKKTYVVTKRDDFNRLGEYGRTTTTSNIPSTPDRISETTYTSAATLEVGSAEYDPTGASVPSLWFTSAFSSKIVRDEGRAVKAEYCFDKQFLTRKRLFRDVGVTPLAGSSDIVVTYGYDTYGNLASETYYGGDPRSSRTGVSGSLCASTPAFGTQGYKIDYKSMNPETADWTETTGYSAGVATRNVQIDQNTGLAKKSIDVAGVETTIDYDSMGRLLSITRTGRAATKYVYPTAASKTLQVSQYGNNNTLLKQSVYSFDGLGRVVRETQLMPDNVTSFRTTLYDDLGRRQSVSELERQISSATQSQHFTVFSYDALGRTTSVITPDGAATTFAYNGIQSKARRATIFTGADTDVTTTETYDGYGRLVAVEELSGPTSGSDPTGSAVYTTYSYSPDDKLLTVAMSGPTANAGQWVVQRRIFDYDGRGFLRWESQPEAGMVAYTYDSRGNVESRTFGAANSHLDLSYTYDSSERLKRVDGRHRDNASTFLPIKTFDYAAVNDGSNRQAGKLRTAKRFNYDPGTELIYEVRHDYIYGDTAGRRTSRITTISDLTEYTGDLTTATNVEPLDDAIRPIKKLEMGMTYNELDLPASMKYPMCLDCGTAPAFPDRSAMTYHYDRGRLELINGVTSEITYWPNGMRHVLGHANGIADTQSVGNMARPSSLKFGEHERCVQPTIVSFPANATVPSGGGSTTLAVTASGTPNLIYEWVQVTTGQTVGTTASVTVAVTQTKEFAVTVSNECGTASADATVAVGSCTTPSVWYITPVRQPDGSWILTPELQAGSSATFEWRSGGNLLGTGRTLTVPPVTITTAYAFTVSEAGCGSDTQSVTLEVPLPGPATLTATASFANNTWAVGITWAAIPGATSDTEYTVERRSGTTWAPVATVTNTTSTVDTTVSPDNTYAYRVTAGDLYSPSDLATTRFFQAPAEGDSIQAIFASEVLAAVNKVRAAVGWPAVTWSNILSATDPLPAPGATVSVRHILSCRARLDEARQALGARAGVYGDAVPTAIEADHFGSIFTLAQ